MGAAKRDENREIALILQNTLGTNVLFPTAVSLTNATPMHVAVVDGSGNQVTGFGGGGLISSVIVGQYKITASAVQLGSNALTNGVIFTAKSTNVGNVFIGGSGVTTTADGTGNGYILEPGNSISFAASNTNLYYVIGTANDVLSWAGS